MAVPLNPKLRALYGRSAPSTPAEAGPAGNDLEPRVDRLLREPGWTPPLTPELGRLLLDASRRRFDAALARQVLTFDPVVTARVLQRAQREAGARRAVLTATDAVEVLSPSGVSWIIAELANQGRIFRAPGYIDAIDGLRRHARAVAEVAGMLAELIPHAALSPEEAWTRGFLTDVGAQVGLVALGGGPAAPPVSVAWPACIAAHASVGARVLRGWGLAEPLVALVGDHHRAVGEELTDRGVALLQLAEALVGAVGVGAAVGVPLAAPESDDEAAFRTAERTLRVHTSGVGGLREEARLVLFRHGLVAASPRTRATG